MLIFMVFAIAWMDGASDQGSVQVFSQEECEVQKAALSAALSAMPNVAGFMSKCWTWPPQDEFSKRDVRFSHK